MRQNLEWVESRKSKMKFGDLYQRCKALISLMWEWVIDDYEGDETNK